MSTGRAAGGTRKPETVPAGTLKSGRAPDVPGLVLPAPPARVRGHFPASAAFTSASLVTAPT